MFRKLLPGKPALVFPLLGIVIWLALISVIAASVNAYYLGLGAMIGINAMLALGLVLVIGYAGQFSLAQAAFFAVGAYGTGILTVKFGWPPIAALIFSALVAGLAAYMLGRPIFRLRGHFLAMATLALTAIVFQLLLNLEITGGASGLGGIEDFSVLGLVLDSDGSKFIMIWLAVGVVLWGLLRIRHSREGRALKAVKGHEAAAAAVGIHISKTKTKAFVGSAVIGSLAGSFYAHQFLYINPSPFDIHASIDILLVAVLGGILTPWGAIAGAVAVELLRQAIDSALPALLGDAAVGAGETLIFGIILVTVLVLRPDGLAGLLDPVRRKLFRRTAGAPTAAAVDMPAPDISADTTLHPAGADTPGDAIALQAKGLTKVYGGVTAVNGVDLRLHEREILAVIGPNGAGKTTLMNLLSGNISPTNGSVQIFGTDVTALPAHTVAGYGLARTFQTPSLFPGMDALANVLVGAHLRGKVGLVRSSIPTPAAVREERSLTAIAEKAMTDLGLDHLRHREVSELSLGQQKLLEVARAVAQQPKILLLDEPCAGLNRVEKLNLSTMLKQLRSRGISLLLIEHDMEFVMGLADRVQVLVFGQTLAAGTPAEIQANQQVLDAYLGKEPEEDKAGTARDQLEEESNA